MSSNNHDINKELVTLLNKCWMTHDGMWFFHCLQSFGIEQTNKLNKAAIHSLAAIEMKRILNYLGFEKQIETFDEFCQFFKQARKLVIPDFMNGSMAFPEENVMTWEFKQNECFAYKGICRLGVIDDYECGVLYRIKCWLEQLGITHIFSPEIDTCLMHHHGRCIGTIRLNFSS